VTPPDARQPASGRGGGLSRGIRTAGVRQLVKMKYFQAPFVVEFTVSPDVLL
jgi:hypothetical protein